MGFEETNNAETNKFENNHMEYKNRAELEVDCDGKRTLYSNEIEAKKLVIRIEKEQSKQCVFKGDHLDYSVKICNDSLIDIVNLVFSDDIPDGLDYVNGTFKVDGDTKTPMRYDNKLSYHINKIEAGKDVTISFRTTVL